MPARDGPQELGGKVIRQSKRHFSTRHIAILPYKLRPRLALSISLRHRTAAPRRRGRQLIGCCWNCQRAFGGTNPICRWTYGGKARETATQAPPCSKE